MVSPKFTLKKRTSATESITLGYKLTLTGLSSSEDTNGVPKPLFTKQMDR